MHLCVYAYERGVDTLKLNIARSAFKLCCSSIIVLFLWKLDGEDVFRLRKLRIFDCFDRFL